MPALRLPENATSILDQAQINVSDSYEDKWLLYNIAPESSSDDTWELFRIGILEQGGYSPKEHELEELGWCWPANTNGHELRTLQEVLDFHFGVVSNRIAGEPTGQEHFTYEFGFVVITGAQWREMGMTAVHLDRDRGKWKVTRCCLLPKDLGGNLTSVWDRDAFFDDVRKEFQDSDENRRIENEDTHVDNQGGPVPWGAWEFVMYSTEVPMREVVNAIPDPRGDGSFECAEECFSAIPGRMSYDEAVEEFPVSYSKFLKGQAELELEGGTRTVVRRHPELFVVIDNEAPAKRGVVIARLPWDRNVERAEDELRRLGRESQVETRRCDVNSLVETLERMADDIGD